ncbi:MAG: hypothetical protein CMC35_06370 [Flavobacteriaceae bacterium]|nr:hypothetical protein [Flavobacteriaceae bacterium]|tara:strand:- start:14168 stop:15283 length:1116 start_codon:yes stop_codon:yes gene_type:complete
MKIIHLIISLGKGGAEKLLVDNLPIYKKMGHDVTVVQLSSMLESEEYVEELKKNDIPLYSLSSGSFRNPLLIVRLRSYLKKNNCDVLHVHLFPPLYWASLATLGLKDKPKLIFTEHSSSNERNTKKIFKPLERFIYSRYDAVIAITERVNEKLLEWLDMPSKIKLIHNGVDIERFNSALPHKPEYFKEHFGTPLTSFKVIMVSRFSYPKDPITLIEAISLLPETVHLFFVGDGELLNDAKIKVEELQLGNRIHFLGFRMDIPELMKGSDLNVLSSLHEGMSGVTLEALASNTAFLGSASPGIQELVPDKRYLFETCNSVDLSKKIIKLFKNPDFKDELASEGYKFVKNYSVHKMIQSHLDLYNLLLKDDML